MFLKIYLFSYFWLCWVFVAEHRPSLVGRAGATPHCVARASHCGGLSCCGARAPGARAQQLWRTGSLASRHVGSSQTRARTRVPCIGRRAPNHCATREALKCFLMWMMSKLTLVGQPTLHRMLILAKIF